MNIANLARLVLGFAALLSLAACASVKQTDLAKPSSAKTALNEGYSLLAYLLKDESDLDKILWIKDANPATAGLIKKIAQTSRDTLTRLESLASEKPGLDLATRGLPSVEAQTRDAISKSTASTLLGSSGKSFELRILLTQVQAMNYATHLCQVLAVSEINPERRSFLKTSGKKFLNLREEAVQRIGN